MPKLKFRSAAILVVYSLSLAGADPKTEIIQQMERFHKAAGDRNATAMASLLADDYQLIVMSGQINDKKLFLDRMATGSTPGGMKVDNQSILLFGDTAIVTETVKVPANDARLIQTSVWVKQGGNWKLAARQSTPVQ